jgi:hypothetical protein
MGSILASSPTPFFFATALISYINNSIFHENPSHALPRERFILPTTMGKSIERASWNPQEQQREEEKHQHAYLDWMS